MRKWKRKNRGFTFVEVLVSVAIFIPLVLMSFQMLNRGLEFWEIICARGDLQVIGQKATSEMVGELRNATRTAGSSPPDATIINAGSGIRFYVPADISGNGLITDNIGNTEWDTSNPIEYRFDNVQDQILRIEGVNQRVVAVNVANINFDDITTDATLNIDEIRISLSLQKTTARQHTLLESSVVSVRLRN